MQVATDCFSVVVAESAEVLRLGQEQMVSDAGPFRLIGSAADAESLSHLVREKRPNIVVLNDSLCGESLQRFVTELKSASPETRFVMCLTEFRNFWVMLETKAEGYCDSQGAEQFKAALNAVSQGQCYIAPKLSSYLLHGDGFKLLQNAIPRGVSALKMLSPRENDVIALLSEGKSNEQIARHLGLSIQTVKVHVKHILKKLNVSDRTQAVIIALKGH